MRKFNVLMSEVTFTLWYCCIFREGRKIYQEFGDNIDLYFFELVVFSKRNTTINSAEVKIKLDTFCSVFYDHILFEGTDVSTKIYRVLGRIE